AARALDADRIPEKAARVGDLGDMRQRQMLIGAPPRREPEFDVAGRYAEPVRRHVQREQQPCQVEMKQRPKPARSHFKPLAGVIGLAHQNLPNPSPPSWGGGVGGGVARLNANVDARASPPDPHPSLPTRGREKKE